MGVTRPATSTDRPETREAACAPRLVRSARAADPFLRGLCPVGAGWLAGQAGAWPPGREARPSETLFLYCVKGAGWIELAGRRHAVRAGQLAVLPAGQPRAFGGQTARPWSVHWIRAVGDQLPRHLAALGVSPAQPVVHVGEDLQAVMLFREVFTLLREAGLPDRPWHAAHALGHLLCLLARRIETQPAPASHPERVARAILHMSEHLAEPLRIRELAALSRLSPAHFTAVFKAHTGCSPRDYLKLLRLHQAREWLRHSDLSIKEIAARVGYADPLHFSRVFKASEGLSPSAYRRRGGPDGSAGAAPSAGRVPQRGGSGSGSGP